ncbi:sulfite exporter TauE/SafE family protein [Porticoccaceae bacterium]|jgi:uncharacterized protein|nr:sulfite exporter TauE/SafE family protein [Porticoccaceae bacterium]
MMNSLIKYLTAIAIGCVVGFIGGFQGIAGGFYISMLLLFSGIAENQKKAAGTTLLAILFPISAGAVYEYWKSDNIDIPVALIITFFYIIFAWVGAKVNPYFSERFVNLTLSVLLLLTSAYFFHKYYMLK